MMQPSDGPVTLSGLKVQLGIASADTADDASLTLALKAVNDLVRGLPVAQLPDGATAWPDRIITGATMLAARVWRRKDSPAGVAALSDFGPVYVQRSDPDVAMLLGLGAWSRPGVG